MPPDDQSQLHKDMITTFTTEQGEKVFSWLLQQCRFDSTVHVYDPYEVLFWEGRRSVVVDMLNEMKDSRLKNRQSAVASVEEAVYEMTEVADTGG